MADSPIEAFMFGSCVSRDVARIYPERLVASDYIARQSWISAFSYVALDRDVSEYFRSQFQAKMVAGDFEGSFPISILGSDLSFDFLVLDLVDERLGVLKTPSGYVTNSYELRNSGLKKTIPGSRSIEFGSEEHFDLWCRSAVRLYSLLKILGLVDRTVLIRCKYSVVSDEGVELSGRMRIAPQIWNARFTRYYDFAAALGFVVIDVPQNLSVAASNHAWGLEAFHYVNEFYGFVADQLEHFKSTMPT